MKRTIRPPISVIIPAHNEEKCLASCLGGILKQTTKTPYEVIVVDNNSTDRTQEIAKKYPVRVIFEKRPGGSAARNAGAKVARGKLLVFLDADTRSPPTYLSQIENFFQKHPTLDVLAGPPVVIDAGPITKWFTDTFNYFTWYFRATKLVSGVQAFWSGNFAIKKRVFEESGGFDQKLTSVIMAEDIEFSVRLGKYGYKIYFDPTLKVDCLFAFRKFHEPLLLNTLKRAWYTNCYLLKARFL